jgi:putative transposase
MLKKCKVNSKTAIGIDLGLKDFAVLSNGEKISNPKYLRQHLHQLKKLQRQASSKTKGSNNRKKANLKVAKEHEKIANLRKDFLHKLSTKLIRENQTVCLEDLNVSGMMQNHCLAQGISDVSWSMFGDMLKYKSDWNGKNVLTIGRFEPSSKMCHCCGEINHRLTLADREWKCSCGVKHYRDLNAAMNIRDFALHQLNRIGAERPELKPVENIRSQRSSRKQETAGSSAQR